MVFVSPHNPYLPRNGIIYQSNRSRSRPFHVREYIYKTNAQVNFKFYRSCSKWICPASQIVVTKHCSTQPILKLDSLRGYHGWQNFISLMDIADVTVYKTERNFADLGHSEFPQIYKLPAKKNTGYLDKFAQIYVYKHIPEHTCLTF